MADDQTPPGEPEGAKPEENQPPADREDSPPAELGDAGKRALDAERSRAKTAEARAKELETELEEFRRSQMSEQEKAIDEARTAARAEALTEVGSKLAHAEFRAAAAGKLDDDQLGVLIDNLDLSKFLTEDGEVDREKVSTVVAGIGSKADTPSVDLGQGSRGGEVAVEMDPRKLAERVQHTW